MTTTDTSTSPKQPAQSTLSDPTLAAPTEPQISPVEYLRRLSAKLSSKRIGTRGAFGGTVSRTRPINCKR